MIVLKPELSQTDVAWACSLLHELGHSTRALEEGRAGRPQSEGLSHQALDEEIEMHRLNQQLWHALGGRAYEQAIEKAIYWIDKQRRQTKSGVCTVTLPDFSAANESFLDPAPSEATRRHRQTEFATQAQFVAFDRWYPGRSRAFQADFLTRQYRPAWVGWRR